jgi:5'-nucleotidase
MWTSGTRILIDQDGPLADFERGFLDRWRQRFPNSPYVPRRERRSFKIRDDYPAEQRVDVESIYVEPGFYLDLPVVDGAAPAIETMRRKGFEIFICTSPLSQYRNCVLEKFLWVERHFGFEFTKRIIVTKDKTLVKANVLIDDAPKVDGLVVTPEWRRILYDAPYNRSVVGVPRLTWQNWRDVIEV